MRRRAWGRLAPAAVLVLALGTLSSCRAPHARLEVGVEAVATDVVIGTRTPPTSEPTTTSVPGEQQ